MKRVSLLLASISIVTLLSGCTVVTPRPAYYGYSQNQRYIQVAPPAPRIEVIGVAPYPGQIWIGGAWFWEGGRHNWHPGYWQAPRPDHDWVPHHWERRGDDWHFREGYWNRRN